MKISIPLFSTLLVVISPFPLAVNAHPAAYQAPKSNIGGVYTMTNSPNENFILTSTIGADGKLTLRNAVPTRGNGASEINATSDPLLSQGSLQVSGNRLYAVNPGSDTISTFAINPQNPAELTLVGEPVSSGGEFPISLAVSPRTGNVCVLNGGQINGINCYKPDVARGLIEIPGTKRLLHLDVATPPVFLNHTPSHVIFSEDGSTIYVSVKGVSPGTEGGFIAAWSVDSNGALSSNFVKSQSSTPGGILFAIKLIPGTDSILAANPQAGGYEIYDYKTPTSVATSTGGLVPRQQAICWLGLSSQTNNFYLIDLAGGVVTELSVNTQNLQGTIVRQYPQGPDTDLGDVQIGRVSGKDHLYMLAAGTKSLIVLSLDGPGNANAVQHLDLTSLPKGDVVIETRFLQGLAVYIP